MKKLGLILALMAFTCVSYAQSITEGTWWNEEKTSRVQFYEQGGKIYGKIVWLEEPTENGKPRVDKNNPKEALKTKPLMGLVFLKGFEKDGDKSWEDGTIYDPRNGKTYSSEMTLVSADQLDVRGYIGISLIGRTSEFTRYKGN
ncbi:DUF2147 domain-containing protein [Jiulongibacter sediminis]|jgi:uncharacterized protein (DUF2147 family)|uniref:DUF2147 domain-containing protein n=1 Tax=Jiulongibacter sediminis TaxID=1605367 RepID=UPI0026F280B6|nr:DUF2147 domain-containing protein [Jiulongibacter sediminis]